MDAPGIEPGTWPTTHPKSLDLGGYTVPREGAPGEAPPIATTA